MGKSDGVLVEGRVVVVEELGEIVDVLASEVVGNVNVWLVAVSVVDDKVVVGTNVKVCVVVVIIGLEDVLLGGLSGVVLVGRMVGVELDEVVDVVVVVENVLGTVGFGVGLTGIV